MSNFNYSVPVDQLLMIGDPSGQPQWPDYVALGFTLEHVPELIRMTLDEELHWADSESKEVWANLHAWRTLGQLRAEAAIEPLLQLFRRIDEDDDDWIDSELSVVYRLIGPAAIPALVNYLHSPKHGIYSRTAASNSLKEIAQQHPQARGDCIAALITQLEKFDEEEPALNAFIMTDLMELKATEALPVIERGFAAERIDITMAGDWEDMQIAFGLKTQRERPRDKALWERFAPPAMKQVKSLVDELRSRSERPTTVQEVEPRGTEPYGEKVRTISPLSRAQQRQLAAHAKSKRKQAKKSRQRNRKRK